MDGDDIRQREASLISFAGDLIASARRNGNDKAFLSEDMISEIKEIAKSPIDFENPAAFDTIRKILEEKIEGM